MQVAATIDDHGLADRLAQSGPFMDSAIREATGVISMMMQADMVGPEGLTKFPSHAPHTRTPSPAGEPPASISGDLLGSVQQAPIVQTGPGTFRGAVGPTKFYASFLDQGSHPILEGTRQRILWSGRGLAVYLQAIDNVLNRRG